MSDTRTAYCAPTPDADQLPSPRRYYYNPMIDPAVLNAMSRNQRQTLTSMPSGMSGGELELVTNKPANLVSSLCEDGLHRPALDADTAFETESHKTKTTQRLAEVFGVPATDVIWSRSSRNWHAYIPTAALPWIDYWVLLYDCLWLVDEEYVSASIGRGQTLLRPPGVAKLYPDPLPKIEPPSHDPDF